MKQFKTLFACSIALTFSLSACAQPEKDSVPAVPVLDTAHVKIEWKRIGKGLDLCETDAPVSSIVNDSKLTILRIDPKLVQFEMHVATEGDKKPRTVSEWADSFGLNIVFNAGMYDLAKPLISRGLLKNGAHFNQAALHPTFNAMFAFGPLDTTKSSCSIFDLEMVSYASLKNKYQSFAQGLRMINGRGEPVYWKKRAQSCSMLVAVEDEQGMIYLIFTRSPYFHNQMTSFMTRFPFPLRNAIYLEGGPETSLYVNVGETKIEKVGSYVSNTYPNDLNDHFWELPNVIGIRVQP